MNKANVTATTAPSTGIPTRKATSRRHSGSRTRKNFGRFPPQGRKAAEHATAPQSCGASVTGLYLPREVFFGRLVFAGAFVPVCASDFGRFFPATSGSFPVDSSR
jgi:hypothetical protein